MTRRVLLVEDDVLLARPLARLLRRAGYECEHVGSCAEARRVSRSFDIAVLDLELPDGFGLELHDDLLALGTARTAVFFTAARSDLLHAAGRVARCVDKSRGVDALLVAMSEALAEVARAAAAGCRDEGASGPAGSDEPPPPRSGVRR